MENVNTGLNGPKGSDLRPGDMGGAYAGATAPKSINRPVNEDAYTSDNPEDILIAKERWGMVNRLLKSSPVHEDYSEWVLDRFAGYSWTEIAERHSVTRSIAQHRVEAAEAFLALKTKHIEF